MAESASSLSHTPNGRERMDAIVPKNQWEQYPEEIQKLITQKFENRFQWKTLEVFKQKLQENKENLDSLVELNPMGVEELIDRIANEVEWSAAQTIEAAAQTIEAAEAIHKTAAQTTEALKKIAKNSKEIDNTKAHKEALKKANQTLSKIYTLFDGGTTGFEETFKKDLPKWREEGMKKIGISGKPYEELSQEEKTKVDASVILSRSDVISIKISPEKQKDFAGLITDLRETAKNIGVESLPFRGVPLTKAEQQNVANLLGVTKDSQVLRDGNLIIAQSENGRIAVDISKIPPERLLLGNSIKASAPEIKENQALKELEKELTSISNKQEKAKTTLELNEKSFKESNGTLDRIKNANNGKNDFKDLPISTLDIKNPESIKNCRAEAIKMADTLHKQAENEGDKKWVEDIEKTATNIVITLNNMEKMSEEYSASQKILDASQEESSNIKKKIESGREAMKKEMLERDAITRSNLSFFESIGFSELGQESLNEFIQSYNSWMGRECNIDSRTFGQKKKEINPDFSTFGGRIDGKNQKELVSFMLGNIETSSKEKDTKHPLSLADVNHDKNGGFEAKINPKTGKTILQDHFSQAKNSKNTIQWNKTTSQQ